MAFANTRYWAGVGPKRINCTNANCDNSIPTGALVHKVHILREKPKCRSCDKAYTIPAGAEKPYLKGQSGKGGDTPANAKGKATSELVEENNLLKAKLKDLGHKVELPSDQTADKKDLEGLKASKELLQKLGMSTSDVDGRIQLLEAKTQSGKMALPTIESKLTAAQAKVTKAATKYNNLLQQLKQAKDEGIKAASLVEQLEQQKVVALAGQGFAQVGLQTMHQPPDDLEEQQKEEWQKVLVSAESTQQEIMRQALDGLAVQLQQMYENFKTANTAKAAATGEANAKATANAAAAQATATPPVENMVIDVDGGNGKAKGDDDLPDLSDDEFPWPVDESFSSTTNMQEEGGATKRLAENTGEHAHPEDKPSKKAVQAFKAQVIAISTCCKGV